MFVSCDFSYCCILTLSYFFLTSTLFAREMACESKCFTIIWKLENASYALEDDFDHKIKSPAFNVEEIHNTCWKLNLCLSGGGIMVFLERLDNKYMEHIEIVCEFALIMADGTVSHVFKSIFPTDEFDIGTYYLASKVDVFCRRRSAFLPQDTLTTRVRIWKFEGEMSKNVQHLARTLIGVEKRSFLWNIENFSCLSVESKKNYEIKSVSSDKKLMSFELFLTGGMVYDETIHFKIIPCCENIKNFSVRVSIVDASKNTVKCFQDTFLVCDTKDFILLYSKRELMEKESTYLKNDVLSFICECAFSFGIVLEEIEESKCDSIIFEKKELVDSCLLKERDVSDPKSILINNLKSLLNNNFLSDVKLRTKSCTYPAHKSILSAQSPVFKAMFSIDMSEKISNCVDIVDLNDDTVSRLLRYIYSAEVGELEWDIAFELYEAADKYQILSLKDICSSYLKNNLCPSNACKLLILADMHQDTDLKGLVQNFILRRGIEIINSEEWEQLMETNLKLAAATMRLKFKV